MFMMMSGRSNIVWTDAGARLYVRRLPWVMFPSLRHRFVPYTQLRASRWNPVEFRDAIK